MVTWVREEGKAPKNQRRKIEADNVEVAPGVPVGSLKNFKAALVRPPQGSRGSVSCGDREALEPVLCHSDYYLVRTCDVVAIWGGIGFTRDLRSTTLCHGKSTSQQPVGCLPVV